MKYFLRAFNKIGKDEEISMDMLKSRKGIKFILGKGKGELNEC